MRLTEGERRELVAACRETLPDDGWRLLLFGSRADDALRGGDIDLLLIADSDALKGRVLALKSTLLVAMKDRIGDQKIDLVVEARENVPSNRFVATVIVRAIELGRGSESERGT